MNSLEGKTGDPEGNERQRNRRKSERVTNVSEQSERWRLIDWFVGGRIISRLLTVRTAANAYHQSSRACGRRIYWRNLPVGSVRGLTMDEFVSVGVSSRRVLNSSAWLTRVRTGSSTYYSSRYEEAFYIYICRACSYICICMCVYMYMYVRSYVYVCAYICICMCVYIHMYGLIYVFV